MRESNEREHWERKHRLSHFQSIMPCFPEHLLSLDFIYFNALQADIFRSCSIQKIKDFQGPKTKFKYFQGLEIGFLKFKGFQGFSRRVRTLRFSNIEITDRHWLSSEKAGLNKRHTLNERVSGNKVKSAFEPIVPGKDACPARASPSILILQ